MVFDLFFYCVTVKTMYSAKCFRRFALQILCTLRVFAFILSASVNGSPASYDEFVENTKQLEHESTIIFFLFDKHLSCLFHKSNKPLFLWLTGAINHSGVVLGEHSKSL